MDSKTVNLMKVASCLDNYCKYLNKDLNDYSEILGYVLRLYQDKICNLSSQGIALIIISLKDKKKEEYEKYIDSYKDKVDEIIKTSKNIDEQLEKMNK